MIIDDRSTIQLAAERRRDLQRSARRARHARRARDARKTRHARPSASERDRRRWWRR
jgi:hypothetical protein